MDQQASTSLTLMGWRRNRKKANRHERGGQQGGPEPRAYSNPKRRKKGRHYHKTTAPYFAARQAEIEAAPISSAPGCDQVTTTPRTVGPDQEGRHVAPTLAQAATGTPAAPIVQDDAGGSGGRNIRAPSGLTGIREERLIGKAISQGWQGNAGWPVGWTAKEFQERMASGLLTIKEQTALAVLRDVAADDSRIRQIAARNALTMESQNIAERHHGERMEYHDRALQARVGGAAGGSGGPDLHLHLHGDASTAIETQHRRAAALEAIAAELAMREVTFEHGKHAVPGAGDSEPDGLGLDPESAIAFGAEG